MNTVTASAHLDTTPPGVARGVSHRKSRRGDRPMAKAFAAAVLGMGVQTLVTTGLVSSSLAAGALGLCSILNPLTLIFALFATLSWFSIEALQTVGGASGINAVDMTFFVCCAVLVVRLFLPGRYALPIRSIVQDDVTKLLFLIACFGTVSLLFGLYKGFVLRAAFRDYRFFIYTPVFYVYVRAAKLRMSEMRLMTVGLFVVGAVQTILVITGNLSLSSTAGGQEGYPLFQRYGTDIGVQTQLHWLPVWWSFPLLVCVSLLLTAQSSMSRLAVVTLCAVAIGSVMILLLTYARGLMISTMVGVVTIVLLNPYGLRRKRFRTFVLAGVVLIAAVYGAELLLKSSGAEGIVSSLFSRYGVASLTEGDRTPAADYALREAFSRPVLGLGLGSPYEEMIYNGRLIHTGGGETGWIWVATRVGFGGLTVLLAVVYVTWRRGLRTLRSFMAQGPLSVGLALGLLGCFMALLVAGTASTMFLFWGASPILGIWLGHVGQLHYLSRSKTIAARR